MSRTPKLSPNQRITLTLLGVAAFAAIGSLVVISFQLREMRSGSEDTKRLAEAAVRQAGATQTLASSAAEQARLMKELAEQTHVQASHTLELALQMKAQASSTSKIAKAAVIQAQEAKAAADAATSAAATAQRSLEMSERPIITVNAEIVGPLTYSPKGDAMMVIRYTLVNSGRTQAVRVFVQAQMKMLHSGMQHPREDMERLCARVTETGSGFMVFPGKPFQMDYHLTAAAEDVQANLVETQGVFIVPAVTDCITYYSSFGPDQYYVRDSYMLKRAVPFGTLDLIPANTELKAGDILLAPNLLAPGESR